MSKAHCRLKKILQCIDDIKFIINDNNYKTTQALNDRILKPAIRMNIVRIAEQFAKLKDDNEFKILEKFSNNDLKGIAAVRNYIAHDYDSTDDLIIEDVIKYNLPKIEKIVKNIDLDKEEN